MFCAGIEKQRELDARAEERADQRQEEAEAIVAANREAAGLALPTDGENLGRGWYCYRGKQPGDVLFGECDRDQVECGMKMITRIEGGLTTDAQRCEPQDQAACFSAQRSLREGPRVLCYPEMELCEGAYTQALSIPGISETRECKAYP